MPFHQQSRTEILFFDALKVCAGALLACMLFWSRTRETVLPPIVGAMTYEEFDALIAELPRIRRAAAKLDAQLGLLRRVVQASEEIARLPQDDAVPLSMRLQRIEGFLEQMARAPADEELTRSLALARKNLRVQLSPFLLALEEMERILRIPVDAHDRIGLRYERTEDWLHLLTHFQKKEEKPKEEL